MIEITDRGVDPDFGPMLRWPSCFRRPARRNDPAQTLLVSPPTAAARPLVAEPSGPRSDPVGALRICGHHAAPGYPGAPLRAPVSSGRQPAADAGYAPGAVGPLSLHARPAGEAVRQSRRSGRQ